MEQYLAWAEKVGSIFRPECRAECGGKKENMRRLEDGLSVTTCYYKGKVEGYGVHACENVLKDSKGKCLYTWRNLNDSCDLIYFFRHANGRRYLIFRRDLYGYSILELETMRELHYIPQVSYPAEGEKFYETFIWTDCHYSLENNLLAVGGCYWAAPVSVIVLDFTNPMEEHGWENWLELEKLIDPEYEIYEDITFSAWDLEKNVLEVTAYHCDRGMKETICLPVRKLRDMLAV